MPEDQDVCVCGHIFDEHDDGAECQAMADGEPCRCVYFEEEE